MAAPTVRVEKATSDLLIGPDWTMNMDICDSINSDHWQAKDVVKAVKKRLQNKNPKVQLLALTLLETMIKNCGDYVHFQVVERNILQEMIKIVRKKTDMHVRDKILVLLDSWQQAFGGPGGKYPQYFWAYDELRRSGVEFPQRSEDAAPIFTPPVTHPGARNSQEGYGMPSNASRRLDETMASEMESLSLSGLNSIRSVMELLTDMLHAVNPNDRQAVKDEVIVDLVEQCRSNQKKLVQLLNSTVDEELLAQGLALNDNLQNLLAKHDAIASGSPMPAEPVNPSPKTIASTSKPAAASDPVEDEEDEDDDFAQLARRRSKTKPVSSEIVSSETNNLALSLNSVDVTATTPATASTSVLSGPLTTLPDPPNPVKTALKEQDMIDLLSSNLSTNSPRTPLTPSSEFIQTGNQMPVSPNKQGYPNAPQPYPLNQGQVPYNSYVAPWAQPQPHPQSQPQPQQHDSQFHMYPHPQPQLQPQVDPHYQPQPQQPQLQPQVDPHYQPQPQQPQPQKPQPQQYHSPSLSHPQPQPQPQVHLHPQPQAHLQPQPQQYHSSPLSHPQAHFQFQPQAQSQPQQYHSPPHPQPQAHFQPQPQSQTHPEPQPLPSNYPPPPWEIATSSDSARSLPATAQPFPISHAITGYTPVQAARPWQQYHSFGSRGTNVATNSGSRQEVGVKPFVPPNKLFEDLVDLKNADGGLKTGGTSSRNSGAGPSMMSGSK